MTGRSCAGPPSISTVNPTRSGALTPAILQGHSETALQLRRQVSAAAGTADPVLILAEPGLDAAQLAAVLHEGRGDQRLHALDCAALSTDILTSRLFGRPELPPRQRRDLDVVARRSALLGAGTVFLANITEMGAALQRRLARVLRDGEVYVDDRPQPVPVLARLVASAVPDVLDDVDASRFWSGLYRRFAACQIELVPLRGRAADIPEIVQALSEELAARKGGAPRAFTPAAMTALGSLAWPGNLDELRELLERILGQPRTSREEVEERRRRARESDPAPAAFVPGSAPTW